jgi:hypothetical protein
MRLKRETAMLSEEQHDKVVRHLVERARPIILEKWRADSCVASTAIAIDVLRMVGIRARAMVCKADIFNSAFVAQITRHGRMPVSPAERDAWHTETGAYAIGLGYAPPGKTPGAHMVAVTERMVLIDLAVDQASRPEHGLLLKPAMGLVSRDWMIGAERVDYLLDNTGPLVIYHAEPWRHEYVTWPDCIDANQRQSTVARIAIILKMLMRADGIPIQPAEPGIPPAVSRVVQF